MAAIEGNIFFVGLMGAGKTTIGKLLAKKLKKTFFDIWITHHYDFVSF